MDKNEKESELLSFDDLNRGLLDYFWIGSGWDQQKDKVKKVKGPCKYDSEIGLNGQAKNVQILFETEEEINQEELLKNSGIDRWGIIGIKISFWTKSDKNIYKLNGFLNSLKKIDKKTFGILTIAGGVYH